MDVSHKRHRKAVHQVARRSAGGFERQAQNKNTRAMRSPTCAGVGKSGSCLGMRGIKPLWQSAAQALSWLPPKKRVAAKAVVSPPPSSLAAGSSCQCRARSMSSTMTKMAVVWSIMPPDPTSTSQRYVATWVTLAQRRCVALAQLVNGCGCADSASLRTASTRLQQRRSPRSSSFRGGDLAGSFQPRQRSRSGSARGAEPVGGEELLRQCSDPADAPRSGQSSVTGPLHPASPRRGPVEPSLKPMVDRRIPPGIAVRKGRATSTLSADSVRRQSGLCAANRRRTRFGAPAGCGKRSGSPSAAG